MATKKKKPVPATVESTIYVGPTLPNGLLNRFTVFYEGRYLPHIEALREKSPALRGLIVPISRFAEARKNASEAGHILNLYSRRVFEEINK